MKTDLDSKVDLVLSNVLDSLITQSNGKAKVVSEATSSEQQSFSGEEDEGWAPVNVSQDYAFQVSIAQVKVIRDISRQITVSNEIQKNCLSHLVNKVVGDGITLQVISKEYSNDPAKLEELAKNPKPDTTVNTLTSNWSLFCEENNFTIRLQNWQRRRHRDGEAIIRIFKGPICPIVRFVYPEYLTPKDSVSEYGITFKDFDYETPVTYHIKYPQASALEDVDASEIVHDKVNVDLETPRGIASAYPIFTNLRRMDRLLVNVSVLAQIQSAIALIRKHQNATSASVSKFLDKTKTGDTTDSVTGVSTRKRKIKAGTIIDAPKGVDYDYPAHAINSDNFIKVIDKELCHIAANYQLPVDWLLTTEPTAPINPGSPTVSMLQTEKSTLYGKVEELFWKVQEMMGVDTQTVKDQYDITFNGPTIPVASVLDQTRADEINMRLHVTSPQHIAARNGTNYVATRIETLQHRATAQPGEVMPGDLGNTNVNSDGLSKANGGQRGSDGAGGNTQK